MPLTIHPLTPERWPDLVDLFGPERGANSGCWCMWPRIPRSEWNTLGKDGRKRRFSNLVKKGPPPGLLVNVDGHPMRLKGLFAIEHGSGSSAVGAVS